MPEPAEEKTVYGRTDLVALRESAFPVTTDDMPSMEIMEVPGAPNGAKKGVATGAAPAAAAAAPVAAATAQR